MIRFYIKYLPLLIGLLIATGCSQQYFDKPQPVDARNIYAFPEPFRGIWTDGNDSLIVGRYYFANIEYQDIAIPYTSKDTTRYVLLLDGKAYPYDSVQQIILGTGSPFEVMNDSIYYQTREVMEAQLGRKAVLRQVGNQFVLNVKNDSNWWEIFLLGVTENGKIVVRYPSLDKLAENNFNPVFSNDKYNYFEVGWNEEKLQRLIEDQIFADTLLVLEQQN